MIDLVVTDLDGTLWGSRPMPHPRTRRALDDLATRNVPLLVATGRRPASTRAPLAAIGIYGVTDEVLGLIPLLTANPGIEIVRTFDDDPEAVRARLEHAEPGVAALVEQTFSENAEEFAWSMNFCSSSNKS